METKHDDVTIFHVDDGKDWAEFLKNTLSGDKYNINCSTMLLDANSKQVPVCKMKLFLVSPSFLEKENNYIFNKQTMSFSDIDVFILLGAQHTELNKAFEGAGISNANWTVLEAAEDPQVFCKMLVTIIEKYESFHGDEYPFRDSAELSSDDTNKRVSGASDNSSTRDSTGSSDDPIYQVPPRARQVIRVRKVLKEMQDNSNDIYLVLDEESDEPLEIVRGDGLLLDTKIIRQAVYKVEIPDNKTGTDYDSIKVGTEKSGYDDINIRQPSSMKKLQDILTSQVNPFSFICSAFGVPENDFRELDAQLASSFKRFWPPQMAHCFYFLDDTFVVDESKQDSKWPTALHFAAEFKLEKVAAALLEIPGMVSACCLKNVDGEYPHDIATRTNSASIRKLIESFLESHKRRLDGHDSGFADKTIFENTTSDSYMTMENLKPDSSVYTHLQAPGQRNLESDTYSIGNKRQSLSSLSSPTSPEPPDVTTIPSNKELTRSQKTRERTLSEGDTSGKKTKRSQSLKSSIVAALGHLRKRRPSQQTTLEKALTSSGKVYSRTPSSNSLNRERKQSSSSLLNDTSTLSGVPRDSGSYSEEESEEVVSLPAQSRSSKNKHKKRKSVRIQRAMKETPSELPSMPVYSNDPSFNIQM